MDNEKDVIDDPSTSPESEEGKSNPEADEGNNKDKNFANLRKKAEDLERENAELRDRLGKEDKRSLVEEKDDESNDTKKYIFERDIKEATRQWNKKNQISTEEWGQIRKKVSLKGDETESEIYDKIDEAYQTLPSVRDKREKELVEKGRKEAMQSFRDDELDLGSGGDIDTGGGEAPRLTTKEKTWLKAFGVSPEEQKKIDKSGNTAEWKIREEAERGIRKDS